MVTHWKKMLLALGVVALSAHGVAAEPPNQIKRFLDTSCAGGNANCQATWQGGGRKSTSSQRIPSWLQMAFVQRADKPSVPSSISDDMRASYEQAVAWQLVAANFKEIVRDSEFKDLVEELDALAERSKKLISFSSSKKVKGKGIASEKPHKEGGMAFGFDAGRMFSPTLSLDSNTKVVGDLQRQAFFVEMKWNF